MRLLDASPSVAGFALFGRLATLNFVSRGRIRFTRVTADVFAITGLHAGIPSQRAGSLHGDRALTMVSTFQLTRSARLSLAHQSPQRSHLHPGLSRIWLAFLHLPLGRSDAVAAGWGKREPGAFTLPSLFVIMLTCHHTSCPRAREPGQSCTRRRRRKLTPKSNVTRIAEYRIP